MSKIHWVCLGTALVLATVKTSVADECALPRLDAFGWQNAPCAPSITTNRSQWSGLVSHVATPQDWHQKWRLPDTTNSIDIIAGEKTLRAGQEKAMTIALLQDVHGNAAADDQLVRFQAKLSDETFKDDGTSQNGLAAWIFQAHTRAKTGYATAQIGDHQSKRSDFHIVPNQITNITLAAPITQSVSPNQQIELVATDITDLYGNVMEDGALIRFQANEETGHKHFAQGLVANGAASAFPISGTKPISTFWRAYIGQAESTTIELRTEPQTLAPQTELQIAPELITRTLQLRAGPFITSAGHRIVDGTDIEFTLSQSVTEKISAPGRMVDGWAEITLPLPSGEQPVTISASLLGVIFTSTIADIDKVESIMMTREIALELRGALS